MVDKDVKRANRKMFRRMLLSSLTKRKSKMLVAIFSILIGACVFFGLSTIYLEVPKQMSKEFRAYGANMIFLPHNQEYLSLEDVEYLKSQIGESEISGITYYSYENVTINEQPMVVAATNIEDSYKTNPYWYIQGGLPQDRDDIIIGNEIAKLLYLKVGDRIAINGYDVNGEKFLKGFKVCGILQTGKSEESLVFVDYNRMKELTKKEDRIGVIEASILRDKEGLYSLEERISAESDRITPVLVKSVADSEYRVLSKLQALIFIVNVIVLLLTMVCVFTTMMAAVSERRNEIGLKKALGALPEEIFNEFISESIVLSVFGSLIGVALGFQFSQSVSLHVFSRGVEFNLIVAVFTVFACVVTTVISSVLPIKKAMMVEPAIVLRGE